MSKAPEPKAPPQKQPSARQLREQKRAEEERRRRMIYIGAGIVGALVLAAVVYMTSFAPRPPDIEGVQFLRNYPGGQHAEGPIGYTENPPIGGPHNPVWQNCGIYDRAVQNEYAVHSLEHGAIWITYDPSLPADQVEALRNLARANALVLLSPYAGLPSPVVASAWAMQLQLPNPSDPRLAQFISRYQNGPLAPEPGATCSGGFGTPL
jgi:hypothetical protein